MARKNKLFSIGDISKLSGASIKSLRYYERIKILEPAFIDPGSSYRYYSFDQVYLVIIIQICIELDIPLKGLADYIDKNETIDLSMLLTHGKASAEKKLKTLLHGLQFIEDVEKQIELADLYRQIQKIYSREILEKLFYIIPCEHPLKNAGMFELSKMFYELDYSEEEFYEFSEYGYICEYSPSCIQSYAFIELPGCKEITELKAKGSMKHIPAGKYFCLQSEAIQIEHASSIFSKQLKGRDSFFVIETEILTGKYKANKPLYELRLIAPT